MLKLVISSKFKTTFGIFVLFLSLLSVTVIVGQEGDDDEEIIPTQSDSQLPQYIWSLAWNPNGGSIALGIGPDSCGATNNDYSVRILDTSSGVIVNNLTYHRCAVKDLDWSPDGSKLVSTGEGAVVWDINTQQPISFFSPENMPGSLDVSWSPNGTQIASTAIADPFVRLWNPFTGQTISSFNALAPSSTTWSPDSTKLAVGGSNMTIWDSVTNQLLLTFSTGSVGKLAWSPDGSKLAAVDSDYNVRVFDALTGALLRILVGHISSVEKIEWSPNSTAIASSSRDGTVRIWDVQTGYQFNLFNGSGPIYSVIWSPDGAQLAFGGEGNYGEITIVTPDFSTIPTPNITLAPSPTPTAAYKHHRCIGE